MKKGSKRENNKTVYPRTDLVILAGGQARRMNGINKLLQKFDEQIQLIKIYQQLKPNIAQVWINSHRDYSIYQKIIPNIYYYQDDETGFQGPLMGIKKCLVACAIRLCAICTLRCNLYPIQSAAQATCGSS